MTTLVIAPTPWRALRTAGTRALPREIGGLLLGHYTEHGPRVTEAPVVPDPRATRIRYRRDAVTAGHILDSFLQSDDSGVLGYLGEWHTHPLPVGPSPTDVRASTRLAEQGGHDIALLVLALGAQGWVGHAMTALPDGSVNAIQVHVEGSGSDR